MVPEPRFGIDGLPDGAEDLERGQVILVHEVLSELHECADGSGRRVELGHLVLGNHLPKSVVGRVEGGALEDHGRGAVQQWAVRHVGVSRDPA